MIPKTVLESLGTAGKPAFVIALEVSIGLALAPYDSYADARKDFLGLIASDAGGILLLHLDSDVNVTRTELYVRSASDRPNDRQDDPLANAVNEALRHLSEGN